MRDVCSSKQMLKEGFKMKRGIIFCLSVVLLFTIVFAGCSGSGKSALIGTWVEEDNPSKVAYVFFKDGSGTEYGDKITWGTRENGQLYTSSDLYDYNISGKVLTLTYSDPELKRIFRSRRYIKK